MTNKEKTTAPGTDAVTLLTDDHDAVRKLFTQFEKATEANKYEIAQRVCKELTVHAQIEEQLFYPAIKDIPEVDEMVLESLEEHRQAKELIAKIRALPEGDEHLEPDFKVLQEDIEHHAGEEEKEMFPKVKKAWDVEQRRDMGDKLEQLKAKLKAQVEQSDSKRVREDVKDAEGARRQS